MPFFSFMTRLTLVFALLGFIGAFAARASDRPAWTTSAPREAKGSKFYVGRASGSATETEAFNEATRDALERAILENFGFRTRVERESFESMTNVEGTKRAQEVSRDVEVHGFEQVDSYREETARGVSAWVLFRYSTSEIAKERARLATAKEAGRPAFSELGGPLKDGGTLEVTSEPPGARVSIDGEPAGMLATPLKITGRLKPGKHYVHIDHPSREPADAEVVILPGKTVSVKKTLAHATAWVRVLTIPSDANVAIDGKLVGISPVEMKVTAGKPVRVEVTHREAGRLVQEVSLTRNETRTLTLELVRRPEFREGFAPVPARPVGRDRKDLYASLVGPGIGIQMTDAQTPRARVAGQGPDVLVGAPVFYSQSTLRGTKTPEIFYGAALEYRLLPDLGLQLGYGRGKNAAVESQAFRIGAQVGLLSRMLLGPDFLAVRGEWGYFLHQIAGSGQPTNQQEVGGAIAYGWRAPIREDALYVELTFTAGTRFFYATSGNRGAALPFVGSAELALGF